jgi:hypothetical protein
MTPQAELALLRQFEPVMRFTQGEKFFPMDVTAYVQACSLWSQRPGQEPVCLAPIAQLTLDSLAQPYPDAFDAVHFLKVTEPLTAVELANYTLQKIRSRQNRGEDFQAGRARLARVGYASRFVDAAFSFALLARGRVPGDSAAAADMLYRRLQQAQAGYHYYGRVVRQQGWLILQYWFFYLFNNWRSGFAGANDHEGDWEMMNLYLTEENGHVKPVWLAYASHDYQGDDLRRHWDDPEVEKVGQHPIIYAGAGSHANYFSPGEYLTELELTLLTPLAVGAERARKFWHNTLRQYGAETPELGEEEARSNIFHVPFVDYARGDGLSLGPGQDKAWTATLLNPVPPWVAQYRGLWGLYTRDPFAGEDAPGGPMYNRDGSVRIAWHNPLGWAGLDKVPPPPQVWHIITQHQTQLQAQHQTLQNQIEEHSAALLMLGVEAEALRGRPDLSRLYEQYQQNIAEQSTHLNSLRAEQAGLQSRTEALQHYAHALESGQKPNLRAHLRRAHRPTTEAELRAGRLAEFWAAISVGLILIGVVALAQFARNYLGLGLVVIMGLFIAIEASFRGRLINLVTRLAIGLALLATLVIAYEFFWELALLGVVIAGLYTIWDNLRELWP